MTGVTVLLAVAAIGFGFSRRFQISVIPLLLFGGFAVSLLFEPEYNVELQRTMELGIVFLVFAAGIELNPRRFRRQRKAVIWVALIQFFAATGIGFLWSFSLGFEGKTALYIAFALSSSSTLVIVRILSHGRQISRPFGRLVVGVLLVQDILIILIIVVMSKAKFGLGEVVLSLLETAVLGVLAFGFQKWIVPRFTVRWILGSELLLLVILAQLFFFSFLADFFELPLVAGAFAAGYSLSRFPFNGIARPLLLSLTDFFLALFFTALGAFVGIPDDPTILIKGILLGLILLIVTPPVVTVIAEFFGLSSRNAVEAGILLAQGSEFALVLGLTGYLTLEDFGRDELSLIACMVTFTMILSPLLANDRTVRWLLRFHPKQSRSYPRVGHCDHVLVIGFGTGGMWVVKSLVSAGHKVLVIDDDPAIIDRLSQSQIPCLRGDGSDLEVLNQAGADKAKLIVSAMQRPSESETILKLGVKAPVLVRVFEEKDAKRIEKLGGIPILNSKASVQTFMDWFVKSGHATDRPEPPE